MNNSYILSHIRWDCKYHIIIIPKFRERVLYGKTKQKLGEILRDLCRHRGINILERHAMSEDDYLIGFNFTVNLFFIIITFKCH